LHRNQRLKTFVIVFILSAIYVFVFGESGLLERLKLEENKQIVLGRIESLKSENKELKKLYGEYRSGRLTDADLLKSGFVKKGNRIVILKGVRDGELSPEEPGVSSATPIEISHYRIIWIVVSMLILLLYFSRQYRTEEA